MPRFGRNECDRCHKGAICHAGDSLTLCRGQGTRRNARTLPVRGGGCLDNRSATEEARMPSEYDFLLPYARAARRTGRGLMLAAAFALGIGCAALVIALPLQQVL